MKPSGIEVGGIQQAGRCNSRQHTQNNDDHDQFDQGKTTLRLLAARLQGFGVKRGVQDCHDYEMQSLLNK